MFESNLTLLLRDITQPCRTNSFRPRPIGDCEDVFRKYWGIPDHHEKEIIVRNGEEQFTMLRCENGLDILADGVPDGWNEESLRRDIGRLRSFLEKRLHLFDKKLAYHIVKADEYLKIRSRFRGYEFTLYSTYLKEVNGGTLKESKDMAGALDEALRTLGFDPEQAVLKVIDYDKMSSALRVTEEPDRRCPVLVRQALRRKTRNRPC